jgi:16S rRNA processing protein RimM
LPTDHESDAVLIGRVGKPHGLDGAFVVEQASEDLERFEVGAEVLVGGEALRVTVARRVGGGRVAIKLDRPVERGTELTIPRSALKPLEADTYYVTDLVGLEVIDADGTRVGVVRDVHPGPANDALELDTGLLLPLVDDCIREVDLDGRRVLLNPGFTS